MSQIIQSGEIIAERFEIVRFIAEGGMGEVYEAIDRVLGGRVALKFLSRHTVDDERVRRRFRREIQLARQVTHANVCRLFDVYQHHIPRGLRPDVEVLFVTMELLEGDTLESRLESHGAMSEEEALPLVRQMANALDAAHESGVIHRDFKPSNVMLVPGTDGETRAVVTDFGLARSVHPTSTSTTPLTGEMRVVGTADYIAPEQLRGQEITPASDVYALGVVMFEMVTGAKPYEAPDAMSLLTKRATQPPSSPLDYNPDLDERWVSVILSCLASEAGERPASARDVAALLSDETADLTRPSIPSPEWAREEAEKPRSPLRWIAAAAAAAAAAALGVFFALDRAPETAAASFEQGTQLTTAEGLELDPSFSPDGEVLAYASNENGTFEIYLRELVPGGRSRQLTADGAQNFEPAFSPDGELVAYHSYDKGGVWVIPAAGGPARQLTQEGSRPAFSPDGEWLVYQSESAPQLSETATPALGPSTLRLVSPDGGSQRQLTRPGSPPGGHGAPAFSPDGEWVAFSASQRSASEIWAIRRDGSALVRLASEPVTAYDPFYDPEGRTLYYSGSSRQVYGLWALSLAADGTPRGEPRQVMNLGLASLRQGAFSRDGKKMAYSTLLTRSNLYSLPLSGDGDATGAPRALTRGSGRHSRPAFSADGSRLSYDHWRLGGNIDIWVMNADGTDAAQATLDPGADTVSSWFPDGQRVAYLGRRGERRYLYAVDLPTGEVETVAQLELDADWAQLGPDGRTLAYHTRAGDVTFNVRLLDLVTGKKRQLTFDSRLMGFPCWSRDGRWLAIQARRNEDRHVMVMPADGSAEPVALVEHPGQSWSYSFSPDADKVAFVSDRGGFWNVWWVSRSTGEERRLTDFALLHAYVRYPVWSPRGDRIVYELAESTGDVWVAERAP